MDGMVAMVNQEEWLVAVDTAFGFSVLEQMGKDFEEGDLVQWVGTDPLGRSEIANVTRGRTVPVYFLNHRVPSTLLRVNLKLTSER